MNDWNWGQFVIIYICTALGITLSFILPVIKKYIPIRGKGIMSFYDIATPYLAILAFSLITAILIVALLKDSIKDPAAALLAGYAWDSTLQKMNATVSTRYILDLRYLSGKVTEDEYKTMKTNIQM